MVKASQKATKADNKIQQALLENFITLQKVMTNLSIKFDNLSDQISKLLDLFEISAKAMAEKDFEKDEIKDEKISKTRTDLDNSFNSGRGGRGVDGGTLNLRATQESEELTQKLNILLEQNKTIARGFTLMNEKIEELFNNSIENESNLTNAEKSLLREKQTLENFKPREYY